MQNRLRWGLIFVGCSHLFKPAHKISPALSSDDHRAITYNLLHTLVLNNEYTFYPQRFFKIIKCYRRESYLLAWSKQIIYPEKLEPISYIISLFSDKVRKPCEIIPLDLFQPQPLSMDEINKKTFTTLINGSGLLRISQKNLLLK